jgi:hypothetical protein
MMGARLTLRLDAPPLAWGRPDSPRRPLCAICHGALPEVPVMMFTEDGWAANFCDKCFKRWFIVKEGE